MSRDQSPVCNVVWRNARGLGHRGEGHKLQDQGPCSGTDIKKKATFDPHSKLYIDRVCMLQQLI